MLRPLSIALLLCGTGLPLAASAEFNPGEAEVYLAATQTPEENMATQGSGGGVLSASAPDDPGNKTCQDCRTQEVTEGSLPKLGRTIYIFGNLSYNCYRMDDVNQFIAGQNQANTLTLGNIGSGGGDNFGAGFWLTDNLALGFEIGSLYAATSSRNEGFRENLNLPAVESGLFLKVGRRFWDHLILSAGGGFYSLNLDGASLVSYNRALAPYDYSVTRIYGYTYSTKALGSAEVMLAPHVGLGLDVGYRWAVIENQRICADGQRSSLLNPDGSKLDIDYSGLFVNTGLRFYFK